MAKKTELAKKFEGLNKGSKIVFNGRKQPLTVTRVITGHKKHGDYGKVVYVKGPRGGEFALTQNMHNPNIITAISMGTMTSDSQRVTSLRRL